jgi:alcohol dehydrogenase class IV
MNKICYNEIKGLKKGKMANKYSFIVDNIKERQKLIEEIIYLESENEKLKTTEKSLESKVESLISTLRLVEKLSKQGVTRQALETVIQDGIDELSHD